MSKQIKHQEHVLHRAQRISSMLIKCFFGLVHHLNNITINTARASSVSAGMDFQTTTISFLLLMLPSNSCES